MNKRQYIITGVAILMILGLSVMIANFIKSSKKDPPKKSLDEIRRVVRVQKTEYSDIETFVSGTGRIVSQQTVKIITEIQGKLLKGEVP